jgi:hypothetical protein
MPKTPAAQRAARRLFALADGARHLCNGAVWNNHQCRRSASVLRVVAYSAPYNDISFPSSKYRGRYIERKALSVLK